MGVIPWLAGVHVVPREGVLATTPSWETYSYYCCIIHKFDCASLMACTLEECKMPQMVLFRTNCHPASSLEFARYFIIVIVMYSQMYIIVQPVLQHKQTSSLFSSVFFPVLFSFSVLREDRICHLESLTF